jgi:hypothetical protein
MSMSLASKKLSSAASNDDDGKELWLEVSSDTTIERAAYLRVLSNAQGSKKSTRYTCTGTLHNSDRMKIDGLKRVQKKLKPETPVKNFMLLEKTKDSLKRLMLQEFEKQIEELMGGDLHRNGAHQERSDNSDSEAGTFIYILCSVNGLHIHTSS